MTTRAIPVALQNHFDLPVQTTCFLLQVRPKGVNAPPIFGVTSLDADVSFDAGDGNGPITYSALAGLVPSRLVSSAGLGVDNGEAETLLGAFSVDSFTEANITAGRYNNADFTLLVVNYKDLAAGAMEETFGSLGRIRIIEGLACFPELRGITAEARQNACKRFSITCRNDFGDARCGVDLGPLWQTTAVTAVGVENDRTFDVSGITVPPQGFAPGMSEWIDGSNAGRSYEIEDFEDLGGGNVRIHLAHTTHFLINPGDGVKIRPDCKKRFREDCIPIYSNGPQFDGEPDIPVGDEGSLAVPGASTEEGRGESSSGAVDESETE